MFSRLPSHAFEDPESFLKAVKLNPGIMDNAEFIVLDHYFDSNSAMNGIELAVEIRRLAYKGKILLSTLSDSDIPEFVDAKVGKNPEDIWQDYLKL